MIYFGVLCLAACVLANPAVYVSRTTLDEGVPYRYYYPMGSPWVALAPGKDGAAREFIIPAEPGKLPLASIMLEPKSKEEEKKMEEIEPKKDEESEGEEALDEEPKEEEPKDEEPKEEEDKPKEEDKDEKPKLRLIAAPGPVDVKFIKPPQFITDFINKIPIKLPYDFPILGPIFGKPPTSVPAPAPAPTPGAEPTPVVRYRLAYPPISSVPISYLK